MELADIITKLQGRGGAEHPHARVLDAAGRRLTLLDPTSSLADTPDSRLAVDEATMSAGFVISSTRRDRAGDVVVPGGCLETLGDYAANPQVFYAHRTAEPPVAQAKSPDGSLALWFEPERILSRAYFHGKTRESDEVFGLVAARVLQAASIGFVPAEADLIEGADVEADLREGRLEFDFGGFVFKRWHLLEWSVVPVPANPEALRGHLDAGRVKSPVLRRTLAPLAAPRKASLWLDGKAQMVCKGLDLAPEARLAKDGGVAEVPDAPPPPAEVDHAGRDQNGAERPQAVLFDASRYASEDDVKAWLELNQLAASSLEGPTDERREYVALLFPAESCRADTARSERVEDGVTVVFCCPQESQVSSEEAPVPEVVSNSVEARVEALVSKRLPRDVVRWNRSLSSVFDVAAEPLPPASLQYDWISRHVGCPVKELSHRSTQVPSARLGSWLTGLKGLLADCKLVDTRNISGGSESPPVYETVQLNSKLKSDFLVEGTSFYRSKQGDFVLRFQPAWWGLYVDVFSKRGDADLGRKLLDDAWAWAREHNFLKGEAFSLSGEFLERTAEGWDDVFLEQANKDALRQVVRRLNEKQKAFPNRGAILTGPPGTGKTLSGRIVRNTAEATFVWVAARDLYRSGGFGGLAYGFELARELAPSVLFIEDVDNYLSDYTVDLLKTEMDGIARSSGVLTVLTTNFPEQLPEALIDRPGRFHDVLCFANPTKAARSEMLKAWLAGASAPVLADAVEKTEGYSGAHLRELANFALSIRESEELELDAAVPLAIAKVEQQKEVIAGVQRHGARYRPHKDVERYVQRHGGAYGPWVKPVTKDAGPAAVVILQPPAEEGGGHEEPDGDEGPLKPYGCTVLEEVCRCTEELWSYLRTSQARMEPDARSTRFVRRLGRAVGKMHRDCHTLGATLYPDHFEAVAVPEGEEAAGGDDDGDEAYAVTGDKAAPAAAAQVVVATPVQRQLDPRVAQAMARLSRAFYSLTGREV